MSMPMPDPMPMPMYFYYTGDVYFLCESWFINKNAGLFFVACLTSFLAAVFVDCLFCINYSLASFFSGLGIYFLLTPWGVFVENYWPDALISAKTGVYI